MPMISNAQPVPWFFYATINYFIFVNWLNFKSSFIYKILYRINNENFLEFYENNLIKINKNSNILDYTTNNYINFHKSKPS
jgi:hypothetical protein